MVAWDCILGCEGGWPMPAEMLLSLTKVVRRELVLVNFCGDLCSTYESSRSPSNSSSSCFLSSFLLTFRGLKAGTEAEVAIDSASRPLSPRRPCAGLLKEGSTLVDFSTLVRSCLSSRARAYWCNRSGFYSACTS